MYFWLPDSIVGMGAVHTGQEGVMGKIIGHVVNSLGDREDRA